MFELYDLQLFIMMLNETQALLAGDHCALTFPAPEIGDANLNFFQKQQQQEISLKFWNFHNA